MTAAIAQPAAHPMKRVFGLRDFLLLWIGQATSNLGDQFHMIAAAWLVLKLTADPLALGAVMALGGVSRAITAIVGGAIADRFSPRKVMLAADIIRLMISALLAAQVFTGTLQVWMLYVYALVSGVLSGLFAPASMSIAPHILPEQDLQAGNAVMQGSMQLIGFVGPALAGALIALFPSNQLGVGLAIAFDAFTFVVSIATLWAMRAGGKPAAAAEQTSVIQSIGQGFSYLIKDPTLRLMFGLIAVANFAFGGPVVVGIPYLANLRFPEGAAAYGLIISGYAGGNLLGIVISGALPKLSQRLLKIFLVVMFAAFGAGVTALGWINITWLATSDLFALGVLNGYLSILLITGLQRNTPKVMLGRLMSMVLLANLIFMPLSQAATGALLRLNIPVSFVAAGGLLALCALYLATPRASALLSAQLVIGHAE